MKKIVFLGCENSHADTFTRFIQNNEKYHDVEIVGAYSPETEALQKFCDRYHVKPMARYDEAVGQVDGIVVTARHGDNHLKYAKPYFKKGLAAFIDKPITVKEEEALELVRCAEDIGVKLTGGSSLRFDSTVMELQEDAKNHANGETIGGFLRFPISINNPYGGFYFYAQHLIESVGAIFGQYPVSVQAFRSKQTITVVFRYEDYDVVGVGSDQSYTYYAARLTPAGTKGREFEVGIENPCFLKEFDEFYDILSGEAQVIHGHDFIAPVFTMNAIMRSLDSGKEETVGRY